MRRTDDLVLLLHKRTLEEVVFAVVIIHQKDLLTAIS